MQVSFPALGIPGLYEWHQSRKLTIMFAQQPSEASNIDSGVQICKPVVLDIILSQIDEAAKWLWDVLGIFHHDPETLPQTIQTFKTRKINSSRKATNQTTTVEDHRFVHRAPRLLVLALEDCVTCHEHSRGFLIEA